MGGCGSKSSADAISAPAAVPPKAPDAGKGSNQTKAASHVHADGKSDKSEATNAILHENYLVEESSQELVDETPVIVVGSTPMVQHTRPGVDLSSNSKAEAEGDAENASFDFEKHVIACAADAEAVSALEAVVGTGSDKNEPSDSAAVAGTIAASYTGSGSDSKGSGVSEFMQAGPAVVPPHPPHAGEAPSSLSAGVSGALNCSTGPEVAAEAAATQEEEVVEEESEVPLLSELGEKQVLLDFFNACGGAGWKKKTNWGRMDEPLRNWHGISIHPTDGSVSKIRLYGNNLTGSLPADLYRLKNLTSVCMSVNALEGPLPPEWARCRQLTEVNLCSNKLSGKLPVKWSAPGALPAITGVYLQINKLTGPLPPEWGRLTTLTALDLSHNKLKGALPPEWSRLEALTKLRLGRNIALSNEVPPEWAELAERAQIDIGATAHKLSRATTGLAVEVKSTDEDLDI